jgi:F420-dependent methylenetetrahydromethanopterin dehydrogenase
MKSNLILACVVTLAAGCASPITKQDQASLAQPINCATATGDIRVLQSEKAHVTKEIAAGVSSIVPISLVVNTAKGTEKANFQVGTGEYNKMIDKKIADIKAQCGN